MCHFVNLITFSESGDSAQVRELLLRGADASATDQDNWTPLHCAAGESFQITRMLLTLSLFVLLSGGTR